MAEPLAVPPAVRHVPMGVDLPGEKEFAAGVDLPLRRQAACGDDGDPAVANPDVRRKAAGRGDHRSVEDCGIESGGWYCNLP